jgi:hypothetical protein
LELLLSFLITNGAAWVQAQRTIYRSAATPISPVDRAALRPFFQDGTLDRIGIANVPTLENPPFYEVFERAGQAIPLDFRTMAAITFDDTILVSDSRRNDGGPWLSLVFHESVHVVQYAYLGQNAFLDRYVRGWAANGFDYYRIPLETDAYELQGLFNRGAGTFSVEAVVANRLGIQNG